MSGICCLCGGTEGPMITQSAGVILRVSGPAIIPRQAHAQWAVCLANLVSRVEAAESTIARLRGLLRERDELWETLSTWEPKHGIGCVRRDTFDHDDWVCGADCEVVAFAAMSSRAGDIDEILEAEARVT